LAGLPIEFVRNGCIDTMKLSEALQMSRNWIYKSLHEDRLTRRLAQRLIALSAATLDPLRKEALTLESIARFLIKSY